MRKPVDGEKAGPERRGNREEIEKKEKEKTWRKRLRRLTEFTFFSQV
ncbi:MAG: hypothetical protein K6G07_00620 [Lachnospiraceae bacterium]|nr:hypothetical protein [Lachnospiraceae bacterium]